MSNTKKPLKWQLESNRKYVIELSEKKFDKCKEEMESLGDQETLRKALHEMNGQPQEIQNIIRYAFFFGKKMGICDISSPLERMFIPDKDVVERFRKRIK